MLGSSFSKRLIEIIIVLSNKKSYTSLKHIAEELNVSIRTVQRELEGMGKTLALYGLSIEQSRGKGLILKGDSGKFLNEISSISNDNSYMTLDVDERRELLFLKCLELREPTKLIEIAKYFDVSESTIARDLDAIEINFKDNNLNLVRKPGFGIQVIGDIRDVNRIKLDHIYNKLEIKQLEGKSKKETLDVKNFFESISGDILMLLNQEIFEQVVNVLLSKNLESFHDISNSSFLSMLIHLTLVIQRIHSKDTFNIEDDNVYEQLSENITEKSDDLIRLLEFRFNVVIPRGEKIYISMLVKSLNRGRFLEARDEPEVHVYTMVLIDLFSLMTNIDLTKDKILYEGLVAHITPTLERLNYGLSVRNPLIEQIKEEYKSLFNVMKKTCGVIEFLLNTTIDDGEIGFILIHFLASIERKKQNETNNNGYKIGILNSGDLGLSLLLTSTLKNKIKGIKNIYMVTQEELYNNKIKDIDLIVTDIHIESETIPFVLVDKILSNQDIVNINDALDTLTNKRRSNIPIGPFDGQKVNYSLLDNIKLEIIQKKYNKDELIKRLLNSLPLTDEEKNNSFRSVLRRESLGRLHVNEDFIVYHAVVKQLNESKIMFFKVDETMREFYDFKGGTLLIMSEKQENTDRHTISMVSLALMEESKLIYEIVSENPNLNKVKVVISTYILKYN